MEKIIPKNMVADLRKNVEKDLTGNQHRYEFYDPFFEVTKRSYTLNDIINKAEAQQTSSFTSVSQDDTRTEIKKINEVWQQTNGKPIADIQDNIDELSFQSIKDRAEQRALIAGQGVELELELERKLVVADYQSMNRIQNPELQESAAQIITDQTKKYQDYDTYFKKNFYPTYKRVENLSTRNNESEASQLNRDSDNKKTPGSINNKNQDSNNQSEKLSLGKTEQTAKVNFIVTENNTENQQPTNKTAIPPEIAKLYLRDGNKYYHPKNKDTVAFEDKGTALETRANTGSIINSMVAIAESRGWEEIKVSGSESFRREAWFKAASRGINVKGYVPSELDKEELSKQTKSNKITQNGASQPGSNKTETSNKKDSYSVLVDHGADNYLHDKKNTPSYFITTRDDSGVEKTTWGVVLKRAVKESGAQPGDKIIVNHEGNKLVTVDVAQRDQTGKVIGYEKTDVVRNSWNVQLAETFSKETPLEAVKKHPELAGAAAAMMAMEKHIDSQGLNKNEQQIVLDRFKSNIVNSIEQSNIPNVKIREQIQVKQEVQTEEKRELER